MVEFKRKKGESFESFLRRFNKRLLQSGKLYEARQKKYLSPKRSKNLQNLRSTEIYSFKFDGKSMNG